MQNATSSPPRESLLVVTLSPVPSPPFRLSATFYRWLFDAGLVDAQSGLRNLVGSSPHALPTDFCVSFFQQMLELFGQWEFVGHMSSSSEWPQGMQKLKCQSTGERWHRISVLNLPCSAAGQEPGGDQLSVPGATDRSAYDIISYSSSH